MENFEFDTARAESLENSGRLAEAAKVYLTGGDTIKAIHLFLQEPSNLESVQRAQDCILSKLWSIICFGYKRTGTPDPLLADLIKLSKQAMEISAPAGRILNQVRFPKFSMSSVTDCACSSVCLKQSPTTRCSSC